MNASNTAIITKDTVTINDQVFAFTGNKDDYTITLETGTTCQFKNGFGTCEGNISSADFQLLDGVSTAILNLYYTETPEEPTNSKDGFIIIVMSIGLIGLSSFALSNPKFFFKLESRLFYKNKDIEPNKIYVFIRKFLATYALFTAIYYLIISIITIGS